MQRVAARSLRFSGCPTAPTPRRVGQVRWALSSTSAQGETHGMSSASLRLAHLFKAQGRADYIGEPLSIEEHSLQAAALAAKERPGDNEVTLAALLHDIGHMLGLEAGQKMGMDGCGVPDHERCGADFARDLGLPERVARLVQNHVSAKRYLCWKDPNYHARLSEASKTTLRFQGGPMTEAEGRAWEADADRDVYLQMRQWDERAKVPGEVVPNFDYYSGLIDSLLSDGTVREPVRYAVSEAQREFWKENGYLVLRSLADFGRLRDVSSWAEEISRWPKTDGKWILHWEVDETAPEGKIFCRAENFVDYHQGMNELAKDFLEDVVSQVAGEDTLLFKEKINYKLPNGSGFAAHQDTPAYLRLGGDRHISAMVAIDAATEENGALEVASGVWGPEDVPLNERGVITPEAEAKMNFVPVTCEPGDVVLFDGWTPHRSARNSSKKARRALFLTYSMARSGDMRQAYYAAKHQGTKGFDAAKTISFQGDFQGTVVA
mmetsp:Transcript_22787/g.53184  ORF Transcript_22787/g.53184 Transcript_22787/m.53184 type:complete len:492 (+) Transcript_22787:109-1584(+)